MTKEEAIAKLKAKRECIELDTNGNAELCDRNCGECKLNYEQGNMGEQKQALDLAIKALEQQSDDCVSRADVITIIQNHWWNCKDIDQLVKALPPVTLTHGTCKECKYSSVHTISLDKIDEIRVCRIQFSKQIKDDYYCANYEKRGNKVGWSSLENVREKVERGNEK